MMKTTTGLASLVAFLIWGCSASGDSSRKIQTLDSTSVVDVRTVESGTAVLLTMKDQSQLFGNLFRSNTDTSRIALNIEEYRSVYVPIDSVEKAEIFIEVERQWTSTMTQQRVITPIVVVLSMGAVVFLYYFVALTQGGGGLW